MTEMRCFHNVCHVMEMTFKKKSDLHVLRKVWHAGGVLCLVFIWLFFEFPTSVFVFAVCWILFVTGDVVRLKNSKYNKILNGWLKPILRTNEVNKFAGTTYLLSSVIFISLLFSHQIVTLSLLFLAFADPIASFVGIKWGRHKIFGHKSYEGFFAAFIICALLTYEFLTYYQVTSSRIVVSIIAGLCGALAELIPLGKMDDNFTMPILSSICLYFLFIFFNIQL